MWDLPGPGLEPVSPALAGGFLTTARPGKPQPWEVVAVVLVREDGDLEEGAMEEWIIKKHLQARVDRRGERDEC